MTARRAAPASLFLTSAIALVTLIGCAAPVDPAALAPTASGTAAPTETGESPDGADGAPSETADETVPDATEAEAEPFATPEGLPAGVEIDQTTGTWVYSDKVAFQDLPVDPDKFLSEPLTSLPELPPIDSLAGQQLADEEGLVDVWDLQQYYTAACMADAGFEWRWVYYDHPFDDTVPAVPLSDAYVIPGTWDDPTPGFQDALWGENNINSPDYDDSYVYHWSTAGCDGYAVHVTGQDNAH